MITSFQELERHVLSHGLRGRIALANAQDEPALAALVRAQRAGAAEGTLIGPADEIARLLRGMGEQVSDYEIVPFTGTELDAAKLAVRTVREGRADMLMKGLLHTADFARAILNRETGLMPQTGRRLLSQCGFFQYDGRIVLITDASININPDVETQIGIVENTLPVAYALGIETPKVAVLSAVETVSEKMPSTVTARRVFCAPVFFCAAACADLTQSKISATMPVALKREGGLPRGLCQLNKIKILFSWR